MALHHGGKPICLIIDYSANWVVGHFDADFVTSWEHSSVFFCRSTVMSRKDINTTAFDIVQQAIGEVAPEPIDEQKKAAQVQGGVVA